MRRVFLLLLMVNLLYAGWALLREREMPASAVGERAPAYPAQLQLAQEEASATVAAEPGPAAAVLPEVAAVPEAGAPATPGASPIELPAEAAIAATGTPTGTPAGGAGAAASVVDEAAATADAAPVSPDPGAVEGSAGLPSPAAAQRAADAGVAAGIGAATSAVCVRVAPLASAAAAERLGVRLAEWVADAEAVSGEVPDRSVYWVHVPARSSDAEAREVVRELASKGVDSFVIRDEPALANGVSLGVFRDAESARALQARMGHVGYPVEIHEVPRQRAGWLLRGRLRAVAPEAALPQGLIDAVAVAGQGIDVVRTDCVAAGAPGAAAPAAAAADEAPAVAPGVAPATARD